MIYTLPIWWNFKPVQDNLIERKHVRALKNIIGPVGICLLFPAVAKAQCCPLTGMCSGVPASWWIAPLGSIAALIVAYYFYKKVMAEPEGNEKMIEIASHVREGSYAYLFSQYKIVAIAETN